MRHRFIRSTTEPKAAYVDAVHDLNPKALYRMPIRQLGLHCVLEEYSGQVLTGKVIGLPERQVFQADRCA